MSESFKCSNFHIFQKSEMNRDRSPRRDRRSGGGGGGGSSGTLRKGPADRRVFLNNLPFEAKWQDLKDLFRKEVGEVAFVELFEVITVRDSTRNFNRLSRYGVHVGFTAASF